MVAFDKLAEAFNGNNVRFLVDNPTLFEIFNIYRLQRKKTTPRNRVDTRGGVADFYAGQLIEYTWESVVTKDLYQYLDTNSTLSSRSVLPTIDMQVLADSQSGSAGDDLQVDFQAEIPDLEDESIDGNYWWIRAHMIVKNTSVVVS